MDKNPLIGVSIIAVVLLVLGSLSNVVGYQSVKSTVISDSPLFSMRTKRAINQASRNTLTSDYLGKGKNNNLLILPRLNETDSLREAISRIQAMDEGTFNRFVEYVVNQINHKDNLKGIDVKELINELRQLRKSTKNIIIYRDTNDEGITYLHNFYLTYCWVPGCLLIACIVFINYDIFCTFS